jgi:hypothetical protein
MINDFISNYIIPSNRGYIINNKPRFGKAMNIDHGHNVKLVEKKSSGEVDHLHTWTKREYTETKLNKNESTKDGWTNNVTRKKIIGRRMKACQNELNDKGECRRRNDLNHNKFHYHYSKTDVRGNICYHGDKPVCRYCRVNCWEYVNNIHMKNFKHI